GFPANRNAVPGISKKLLLTGNATVELVNQFGKGEKLLAEYFQPSTLHQQLRLEGEYPFLLSTPIGVKSSFKLFRSDSTFTEKLFEVGGQYYFNYDSKLEIFWNRGTSDIGFVDTLNIIKTKKLPVNLDYRTDYFGLTFSMQRLDFKLNPRKGYSMSLSVGVGRRNIYPNNEITSIRGQDPKPFDYRSLYDTVTLHSTLFRPLVDVRLYIPLFKRMSFMIRTNGGMISGPKQVYNNEKFRIGGNKSLRGWNEQSVYTTSFLVATTELKMNLDELSSLFLFTDNGWINASNVAIEQFAWQLGVGAGINFATKVGVFGVSVALGKNRNIPFDFQTAKIHFGYQSVF
ncbi:MAG TPA: BamA/TamA family outer membrane protein, partial [Saprospiraceae bacterium]|nr:BamA/TamA family outer membrane protein [Saprospiraceae bacterium]